MTIVRPVCENDRKEVAELLDEIFRRTRGVVDQQMSTDFPLLFSPANLPNCRVLVEDGRIVSHAGLWPRELIVGERRLKAGVLVAVATAPDRRHCGYAARTVSALQELMSVQEYDFGLLWTGAPDFYRQLGWEVVSTRGMQITIVPGRFAAADTTAGAFEIQRFDPARHLKDVLAMHQRETMRFEREPEACRRLLTLPKIETWIATGRFGAREAAAYLVYATACNKRGLIEYGGTLDGIVALVRHVARRLPSEADLPLLAYHVRPDLIAWAQRLDLPLRPLESSKGFGCEMILRVHPEQLPSDLSDQIFAWGLDQA